MTNETPLISAVMCTRNRHESVGAAVASVLANDHPAFELVVIDQSDSDATEVELRERFGDDARLRYEHTKRVGLSPAYNVGIAAARGGIIGFTDDDCVASVDWLSCIVRAFQAHPEVHLLYGQVRKPSNFDGVGELPTLEFESRWAIGKPQRFSVFGMGANFAARRELFEQVGGFDEILGGGGPLRSSQDFDFSYRVYRAGLLAMAEPTVKVDHYGVRDPEQWQATLYAYGVGNGGFYTKHARCGDLASLRSFAAHTVTVFTKSLILHRSYFKGYLYGMTRSFRYRIDRKSRVYLAN